MLKLKTTRQFGGLFIWNLLGHFLTNNILVTKEKWSIGFYNSLNFFSTSYNLSVLNYTLLVQKSGQKVLVYKHKIEVIREKHSPWENKVYNRKARDKL